MSNEQTTDRIETTIFAGGDGGGYVVPPGMVVTGYSNSGEKQMTVRDQTTIGRLARLEAKVDFLVRGMVLLAEGRREDLMLKARTLQDQLESLKHAE